MVMATSMCLFVVLTSLGTVVMSRDGCSVKFGRRGCSHRVVHGVIVECNGHHVKTTVPHNIPQDTVHLTLVNFNLTRLTRADLAQFTNVQCLTVSDSKLLSDVDSDAFSSMTSLVELTLDATNINESQMAFINDESFANVELLAVTRSQRLTQLWRHGATKTLHSLRTLDLKHSNIYYIDPAVYPELRRLEKLSLTGNRLQSLNWTLIAGHLTHLNSLLLADNEFQTLPSASAAVVLYSVKELTLGSNPLHCNCQLSWLRDFYLHSAVDKTLDSVRCASPLHQLISDTAVQLNFQCVEPEIPVITWSEFTQERRIELNCTSRGDPSPQLSIRLPDSRGLIIPPDDRMAVQQTTSPQLLTHAGLVTCQAVNSLGYNLITTWVGPLQREQVLSYSIRYLPDIPVVILLLILTLRITTC